MPFPHPRKIALIEQSDRRTFVVPYSVLEADWLRDERDAYILDEQFVAEQRVVAEREPRPLAAFIGSGGLHVDAFVAAAFDQALDGETIDERFLAQAGAIAAIEALAMAVFQRPLTYRDRLMLGMETVREWNRRAARHPEPTERTELQHRYDEWLCDHQAGAR